MNAATINERSAWTNLVPWFWKVPVVSERVAARLFVTPFGSLHPDERTEPEAAGRRETLIAARPFSVTSYGTGRPVFLVHGWGGCGLQMSGFVDDLVARGYEVVSIDLPAHGDSVGIQTSVLEASRALLAVMRRFGQPAGVVAHSFGAAVTVLAQQQGLRPDALVFIAPLPSLDVGMKQFAVRAQLPLPVVDKATRLIERQVGLDRHAINLSQLGPELRTPLLLIHDESDRTVSLNHSHEIATSWPGARVLTTQGLGHRRLLRDRSVVQHAAAFFSQGVEQRESDLTELVAPITELAP